MIEALIQSMRPKQWSKNLLLFVGIIFSQNILQTSLLLKSVAAFGIFCIISGSIYLVNDIADIESDRAHPLKSQRPIASGRLKISTAAVVLIILISGSIPLSFILDFQFGIVVLAYFLSILAYSVVLKHIVILDVMIVTLGFVLRAIAGAVVIHVKISSWLLICTIFLALFLTLCKRRHELVLLGNSSGNHRKSLIEYNPYLLDQMIAITTASAVIFYALYTTSQETVAKFGTRNLIFTLPFVIYGIFRYLYLVHQKNMGGSPELIFIQDRSMIINIILYCVVVILVLYMN
jgi:4-hydroxybenzoate polyprenyltransferase